MMTTIANRSARFALIASLALASSCAPAPPDGEPTLDDVRAATERYADVEVALAAGYVRDWLDSCETPYHMGLTDETGAMGIHFVRPDLLEIGPDGTRLDVASTHTDFLEPAVLIYEPQADGSLELVALENLVSAEAWEAAGHLEPPSFHGVPFDYRPDDPSMMTRAQYDRHVWLYRDNPNGIFAQYNPAVSCRHHEYNMPMIVPPGRHPAH